MIALNELLNNIDDYNNAYRLMGKKINLQVFLSLENKLKNFQLKAEHNRAECNKKSSEIVKLKQANQDTSEALKEILKLDANAKKYLSKQKNVTLKIEKKLKKLHNLPDEKNTHNLQIETNKRASDLNSLKSKITRLCRIEAYFKSVNCFVKSQAERVFSENELPIATYCKNGVVLLCERDKIDVILNELLNYLKENSISIIERSVYKLKKSSTREFFIHLNRRLYLKLEIKREFYTREHKIKYRDTKTDTTKFVNQINLIF